VPSVQTADLARMRSELLFDGPDRTRKLSRFWILLVLAAVIASAGVVTDSTATVIGAMIVAPLMTPILGIVLSIVTADRANLIRSLLLVVGGALAVVAVGWVLALFTSMPVVAATSSQVAGRIEPRLFDLVAALATGAVGAFALVRDDVGDTLPGVAIAISLVPPLAVVGLTLQSGAPDQAWGALLLFTTNVTAILLTGVIVMSAYNVRGIAADVDGDTKRFRRGIAIGVVVVSSVLIAIPLAATSARIMDETLDQYRVNDVASSWAEASGWEILFVEKRDDVVVVRTSGPLPSPDPAALRAQLDAAGLAGKHVQVELVPEDRVDLPATTN